MTSQNTIPPLPVPPLENGDRLTRSEFERRYLTMHEVKAELIEGIVYMSSPLRFRSHSSKPHAYIMTWLGFYEASTPGVELGDNATVHLDADNEPQLDALLRIEGGQSRISADDYVEGAPELIVEIATSSASFDLHDKLLVFRRNQLQEYLVWRVYENQIDWFRLREGDYIQLESNSEGRICSQVFPGLWLEKSALLAGNLARVLKVLQQELSSKKRDNFWHNLS